MLAQQNFVEVKTFCMSGPGTEIINRLLKQGWVLLDVRIIERKRCHENNLILAEPGYCYVMGRPA